MRASPHPTARGSNHSPSTCWEIQRGLCSNPPALPQVLTHPSGHCWGQGCGGVTATTSRCQVVLRAVARYQGTLHSQAASVHVDSGLQVPLELPGVSERCHCLGLRLALPGQPQKAPSSCACCIPAACFLSQDSTPQNWLRVRKSNSDTWDCDSRERLLTTTGTPGHHWHRRAAELPRACKGPICRHTWQPSAAARPCPPFPE